VNYLLVVFFLLLLIWKLTTTQHVYLFSFRIRIPPLKQLSYFISFVFLFKRNFFKFLSRYIYASAGIVVQQRPVHIHFLKRSKYWNVIFFPSVFYREELLVENENGLMNVLKNSTVLGCSVFCSNSSEDIDRT